MAHKDDDGWYFNSTDSTFIGYGIGLSNLNGNLTQAAHFIITPSADHPGFYRLVNATDHPCEGVHGLPVHLSGGGQYLVSTFNGNQFFPDYMGGVEIEPGVLEFAVTEKRTKEEIDTLVKLMLEA